MHTCLQGLTMALFLAACSTSPGAPSAPGSSGSGGYTFQGGIRVASGSPIGLGQSVLVLYVRASDDMTSNLAMLRTAEQNEFGSVSQFFDESSFGNLSFAFTHAPTVGDWYQLPETYDNYMWTMADVSSASAPADVTNATDNLNLVQDFSGFFGDALQAATDGGFNVGSFDQVAVVVIGPFHRGTSFNAANFTLTAAPGSSPPTFQVSLPTLVVSTNTGWSRTAHEMGHAFGDFADLYDAPNRDVGNWDLMSCTDCGAQTTGWHKDRKAGWFTGGSRLKALDRPEGTTQESDTTSLTTYETQNPPPGAIQSLRLDCGGGIHLYVENRRGIAGQVGSQALPASGVIVTDADDNADVANTTRPPILLFAGPLTSGQIFTDQTYGPLRLEIGGTPPDLTVTTVWGPDPYYDLAISPWQPPPYESPDIWIDSPANGWDTYQYKSALKNPLVAGNPIRNGDKPRTGQVNRVHARIQNTGSTDASNVRVSFLASTPPGIGDTGNWSLLERVTIPILAAGASVVAGPVEWTPRVATHSCIKARIDHQPEELNANNNEAQENIDDFDTTSTSPWHVIESEVLVSNPTRLFQNLRLEMSGLRPEWTGWVSERFVSLAPGASRLVKYRIDPGLTPLGEPVSADVSIDGWVRVGDADALIGGVTAAVHLVEKASLTLGRTGPQLPRLEELSDVIVTATLGPVAAGYIVRLDVTAEPSGKSSSHTATTDGSGRARWSLDRLRQSGALVELRPGGKYVLTAELPSNGRLAETTSAPLALAIRP
ncbi:MAG: hypothetical protein HOP15_16100 [Planctomycetes bacterium]|nr:hypothetical protein [Planctomycetota bacterium]